MTSSITEIFDPTTSINPSTSFTEPPTSLSEGIIPPTTSPNDPPIFHTQDTTDSTSSFTSSISSLSGKVGTSTSETITALSSTASTPRVTPQISFLLNILTTCEPATIQWKGSNIDNISFNLTISYDDPDSPTHAKSEFPLANAVNASTNVYDWPKVNIPEGRYTLNALDQINTRTLAMGPFLVDNGTDTSCLLSNGSSNMTSIEQPGPSSTSASSPLHTNTSSKPSTKLPTIIGATVGPVLFVIMLISLIYLYWWRKAPQLTQNTPPINPYPAEYLKSSDIVPHKFRENEGTDSSNEAAPDHLETPHGHARVHRHEDSGWRPQPPPSTTGGSLIHMPPEYENAL
ncbi:hypothetical protein VNI00_017295 [Paramarasmius palmivorus]|uniref:Uncharacterized protein n=1 Tax=Paramarasmius palmivorus TaxID=297713 RepID=A0AAW0B7B9_9AGAR